MTDRGMLGASFATTTGQPAEGLGPVRRRGGKPNFDAYEFVEQPDSLRNVEQQGRLYEESVGLPNRASDPGVRERAKMAVAGCLTDTVNVMEFLRNKFLVLYRLYRGDSLAANPYGRISLHSPEPFKAVETVHPRVMRAVFGNPDFFRLFGAEQVHDHAARMQEVLCRHQLRETEFESKLSTLIRSTLIYGTGIQKCYWKQSIKRVRYRSARRVPDERIPGATRLQVSDVDREELICNRNDVCPVSVFDFFIPPSARSVQAAEWCADRSNWPAYKVREMGELGHWINLEEIKDYASQVPDTFGDEFKERKSYAYGVVDPMQSVQTPHVSHYTCIDWWGPLDLDDNRKQVMCNVVMLDPQGKQLVVRVTEHPYWHDEKPYQAHRWITLDEEFWGIGLLEMIARLSMEKDAKRMLGMSASQLAANPMLAVSDEANIPDDQMTAVPGKIWRCSPDAIAPIHVPAVSDEAYKAEGVLTQDIRETTGTTSPMMGAADSADPNKTATQFQGELSEASMRISDGIRNLENDLLVPMLEQMCWNNIQFISKQQVIYDVGAQGLRYQDRYTITPEMILGKFLVQPLVGQQLSSRMVQTQQLINLLDRAPMINQVYGPNQIRVPRLLAKIFTEGFGFRDVSEFIKPAPEDSNVMSVIDEHEAWYHRVVPPVRTDDNHYRHMLGHMEELKAERFELLQRDAPQITERARAHIAEHARILALQFELQEQAIMLAQQQGIVSGGGNEEAGGRGAASPDQDPDSPSFRGKSGEEPAMPESENDAAKSEGSQSRPNAGGQ